MSRNYYVKSFKQKHTHTHTRPQYFNAGFVKVSINIPQNQILQSNILGFLIPLARQPLYLALPKPMIEKSITSQLLNLSAGFHVHVPDFWA